LKRCGRVGLTPEKILAAPAKLLRDITRLDGSVAAEERAERLQSAARLTLDEFRRRPRLHPETAPAKGEEVADAVPYDWRAGRREDSAFLGCTRRAGTGISGLRVLAKSYAATYHSDREATTFADGPMCHACPVAADCSYFQ